jgi:hypothetical protein
MPIDSSQASFKNETSLSKTIPKAEFAHFVFCIIWKASITDGTVTDFAS